MGRILGLILTIGVTWGAEKAASELKPPVIGDSDKLAAWQSQAVLLAAEVALRDTEQYKALLIRQAEIQAMGQRLQAVCGQGFTLVWTPKDIACGVTTPSPQPASQRSDSSLNKKK